MLLKPSLFPLVGAFGTGGFVSGGGKTGQFVAVSAHDQHKSRFFFELIYLSVSRYPGCVHGMASRQKVGVGEVRCAIPSFLHLGPLAPVPRTGNVAAIAPQALGPPRSRVVEALLTC